MSSLNKGIHEYNQNRGQSSMLLRVIAFVLFLALCISFVGDNSLTTHAGTADGDFDVYTYMADNILSDETYAGGRFNYYYNSVKSQAQIWSGSMTKEFADSVRAWEYANIALDPSSALDKPIDARGYYVSIILDMLKISYGDSKFVLDKLLDKNVKNGSKIYTSFAKMFKDASNIELEEYLNRYDHTDDQAALLETVQKAYLHDNKFLESAQAIDDLLKAVKTGKSVVECVDTFLSYCALQDVSNEWYICIKNMRRYCDSSNAPLCNALDLIIEQMESDDYKNAAYRIALDKAQDGAVGLLKKGINMLWEDCLTGPISAAVKWGKTIGGSINNFLFGTDKTIEAYYTVNAYCIVMDLFKSSFEEIKRLYRNEPTTDNAALLLRAVDMYFNLLQTGNKFGQEFTDVLYEGGVVNLIFRSQGEYKKKTKQTEYFIEKTDEAHSYVMAAWLMDLYENGEIDLYNTYADIVGQENIDALYYIPVGSLSFEKDSVEWGLHDYEYSGYECTVLPNTATFKEVVYTSSDRNVAEITNDGSVRVYGQGTCIITATSADDEALSDTLSVTVVEGNGADSVKLELIEPITPEKPKESGLKFKELSNGTYEVSGLGDTLSKDTLTEITIPSSYNGKKVTVIGSGVFSGCEILTSVTIPDSIVKIDKSAFFNCISLKSVEIPESVRIIENSAFGNCTGLKSVTISEGVTRINDSSFAGCTSLVSIMLPKSVILIGDFAFDGCKSLVSLEIADSVTTIGVCAFRNCTSLKSAMIPESVTSIKGGTFFGCENMTAVTIFDGVSEIEDCYQPVGTSGIYYGAFANCKSLTSVAVPDSVKRIGSRAFYDCISLTSLRMSNSVAKIGDSAFYGCSSLKSIMLPDGIMSIGEYAFHGCSSLSSITIPQSVVTIGRYAFAACISLTSVVIPNGVTTIEDGTFGSCLGLESVVIPNSVVKICGDFSGAFGNCTSLKSITIPNSVTNIGMYAFSGCTSLRSLTIPSSVITFGGFSNCKGLKSVTISEGVTTIIGGDYSYCGAFYNCASLASVVIPKSVTTIDRYAFGNCDIVKDVYYAGTEDEWNAIKIVPQFKNAIIHYNVITPPDFIDKVNISISLPKPAGSTIGGGFKASAQSLDGSITELSIDENGNLDVSSIPDGEYTFTFSADYCAPRSYTVSISSGTVTGLEDGVELRLYGDIDDKGDGIVDIRDVAKANMYFKTGEGISDYLLTVADVNGDGVINIIDVARMNAHFKQTGNLWAE